MAKKLLSPLERVSPAVKSKVERFLDDSIIIENGHYELKKGVTPKHFLDFLVQEIADTEERLSLPPRPGFI